MKPPRTLRWLFLLGLLVLTPGTILGQQCMADVLCVEIEEHGDVVRFFVENLRPDDIIVTIDVDEKNMISVVSFPYEKTYAGHSRTLAFTMRQNRKGTPWGYNYQFSWKPALVRREQCSKDIFCVMFEERGDSITVIIDNKQPFDVSLEMEVELVNAVADVFFPLTRSFPGSQRTRAFGLRKVNLRRDMQYRYTYRWTEGVLLAQHDDTFAYVLPYAQGKAYRVIQGFNGSFSHQDRHAIDWDLPERTPVHAARAGVVVAMADSFNKGGLEERLKTLANYITIQHDDGTLGHYVHLAPNGAFVRMGLRVRQGQMIGVSGDTGFSSGPHLHFEVFMIKSDLTRQTVPIRFRTSPTTVEELKAGRMYEAPLL